MVLSFDPRDHSYWADGRKLPSVTQILRATGLYSDYSFAQDHHRWRGSAVHACCAIWDAGGRPRVEAPAAYQQIANDIMKGYLPAFATWKDRTKFQGYCWECPLIDPVAGYAGCFDVVGRFGDSPEVIIPDLKSGALPDLVPLQLEAYVQLIHKGIPVDPAHPGWEWVQENVRSGVPVRRVAVRLEKSGKDSMFSQTSKGDSYDSPMWASAWRSCLNTYVLRGNYGLLEERQ